MEKNVRSCGLTLVWLYHCLLKKIDDNLIRILVELKKCDLKELGFGVL